jgi:hypothetical protein
MDLVDDEDEEDPPPLEDTMTDALDSFYASLGDEGSRTVSGSNSPAPAAPSGTHSPSPLPSTTGMSSPNLNDDGSQSPYDEDKKRKKVGREIFNVEVSKCFFSGKIFDSTLHEEKGRGYLGGEMAKHPGRSEENKVKILVQWLLCKLDFQNTHGDIETRMHVGFSSEHVSLISA